MISPNPAVKIDRTGRPPSGSVTVPPSKVPHRVAAAGGLNVYYYPASVDTGFGGAATAFAR